MINFPIELAKKIRLCILDVDGVLTSGRLFFGPNQLRLLDFHVRDGLGIKLLQKTGVLVALITARESEALTTRAQELKIQYVFQNQPEKLTAYETLKKQLHLTDNEIAYMGDDLTDLPLLRRVGLPVTVANAPPIIQENVAWISHKKGGKGAVREFCEAIMQAQKTWDTIIQSFLRD